MSEQELWNELGNLYFLSGSYDHAVRAYNHAIDLNPEIGEPYNNLALTYVQKGKYHDALEFYQRGLQRVSDELDKAVLLYKLGEVYLHLKRFSQAAEVYRQSDELVPDLGQIIEASAPSDLLLHCPSIPSVHQEAGTGTEASPTIAYEMNNHPFVEELTPWWFDGQVEPDEEPESYYDLPSMDETGVDGSNEDIISDERLTWEPEPVPHTEMIESEQQQEHGESEAADHIAEDANQGKGAEEPVEQEAPLIDEESQTFIDEIPASGPKGAAVLVVTDEPEILTESPEFSVESMTNTEVLQYDTPVEWPVVELSETARKEILVEINRFKRLLEINPRNAFAWDALGGNYKTLGQYEEAIDAYQKAVSIDSTKAFYFHHLGLVYAAVGRYDEAIDAFERVIEVDPNHGPAHATLGGYYRKKGHEELATEHIEVARALLADDENEYNRACMEAICGNADQSLEFLELALKNSQTYVNWARMDPDLDFIRRDPRFHALLAEYAM